MSKLHQQNCAKLQNRSICLKGLPKYIKSNPSVCDISRSSPCVWNIANFLNLLQIELSSHQRKLYQNHIPLLGVYCKLYHSASENCQVILERTHKASLSYKLQKLCQAAHQVPLLLWDNIVRDLITLCIKLKVVL